MKNQKGFSLIELLIVVIIIMIIAAIAIPSLLRARLSANESATVGDIRTVISGQAAYASANTGLFASVATCLTVPSGCIPNYSPAAPTFLDSAIGNLITKSGYDRAYTAGAVPANVPPQAAPGSPVAYVYLASPTDVNRTGVRGFGGDASGVLCSTPNGTAPPTTGSIGLDTTGCDVFQ